MASSDTKVVLITGANTGVGLSAAKLLLAASPLYHILIGSRSTAKGVAAVAELKALQQTLGQVTPVQIDVNSESSIKAAAAFVQDTFGRLDSLVNNAGICDPPPDGSYTSSKVLRSLLETNLVGACSATEAFLPLLRRSSDPRLIFLTSSLASFAMGSDPSLHQYRAATEKFQFREYRISKAAVNMAMLEYLKALEFEAEKEKSVRIRVWSVDPGMNRTNLITNHIEEAHVARWKSLPDPDQNGGKVISDVVLGKRDEDEGKVVWLEGVRPW